MRTFRNSLTLVLIICFAVISNAFSEEIRFRGIPWRSDIDAFSSLFEHDRHVSVNDDDRLMSWSDRKRQTDPNTVSIDMLPGGNAPSGWTAFVMCLDMGNTIKVAGHPISSVIAFFTYGIDDNGDLLTSREKSEFYMAEYSFYVLDGDFAYDDLKQKLTDLYGQGDETIDDIKIISFDSEAMKAQFVDAEIYKYIIYGENSSVCMLEKVISEENVISLSLVYADTKGDNRIQDTIDARKRESVQQERLDSIGSNDGL